MLPSLEGRDWALVGAPSQLQSGFVVGISLGLSVGVVIDAVQSWLGLRGSVHKWVVRRKILLSCILGCLLTVGDTGR